MNQLSQFGTDWTDQWRRVQRLHARVDRISLGEFIDKDEALDDVFAFFLNCHHLTDWVVESGYRSEVSTYAFVNSHFELRLCAHLANGHKHFRLQPRRGVDTTLSTATVSAPMVWLAVDDSVRVIPPQPEPGKNWMVTSFTGDIDMFELADKCLELWRDFLK